MLKVIMLSAVMLNFYPCFCQSKQILTSVKFCVKMTLTATVAALVLATLGEGTQIEKNITADSNLKYRRLVEQNKTSLILKSFW